MTAQPSSARPEVVEEAEPGSPAPRDEEAAQTWMERFLEWQASESSAKK